MKTPLHERQLAMGAKMVGFNGWEMPVQYKGVVSEHNAVRNAVGLFDVSNMGRIQIEGPEAETMLDYLSTNRILNHPDLSVVYTLFCKRDGGCIDDCLVYRVDKNKFYLIVNGGNRSTDLMYFKMVGESFNVRVIPLFDNEGILALQGPKSWTVLSKVFPDLPSIVKMHFIETTYDGKPATISRTGYTGEDGFEIVVPNDSVVRLWDALLAAGKDEGIEPAGLGARDTLRLEMGYALYGHELSRTIAPVESIAAWTIKWDRDFLFKQALESISKDSHRRWSFGVIMDDKAIPREGCKVFSNDKEIGVVTSGGFSPTLNTPIAIVMVHEELTEGQKVEIEIRDQKRSAHRVNFPFYQHQMRDEHHVLHGKS